MLPGKIPAKKDRNDEREFYSLSQMKPIMRASLPETRLKRCLGVGFGWMLTVASSGDVNLLNPFTRAQIKLPNLKSPPCSGPHLLDEFCFASRAVLSADPSHSSSFVLLALFSPIGLGFWMTGNKCWKRIEPFVPPVPFFDITYHRGKFYIVNQHASAIWVWDPLGSHKSAEVEFMFEVEECYLRALDIYLVESFDGELLLITSHCNDSVYRFRRGVFFRIMRLDIVNRQATQITHIGNGAVFVGANASLSVAASAFPDLVRPNCIYFARSGLESFSGGIVCTYGKGKNMGIYDLKDGSLEWLVVDEPPNRICAPVWIAPSL